MFWLSIFFGHGCVHEFMTHVVDVIYTMPVVDDECGHEFNITLADTDIKTLHMMIL